MSTRTVSNVSSLTSKEKLKDKADLYRRLATLSREYKKSQLEDILGPFFNTTNDGIKGNVYQLPYKPGMPAPPNVTYSTPRYDTSLYSQTQTQTQQTTGVSPIPYTTPKKSDVRTVQPGDDKPKTKADIEEEMADKEHKENIKSSLDRITRLLGQYKQEKEAKIIEDTEPQKTVYTVDPQPTKELERVIEKEESEPLSNMELDALLQEIQMKDKSITEEMYHRLYQHLSTLDEFKGMRENDVRFIALSMLKERGADALQMPSPEFMKSKSELVEDILQHVDPDTDSFKGGIGRAIDSDTYQIDYTTAGRRVLDPNTGRPVQGGVRNVQFIVNDDSTISIVINNTQGGSSSVLLHPDDYDTMIRALRANSTSVVTRLINSIANRNFPPGGRSDPAKYISTRRPAEERLYPPRKAPASSKKIPSTAPDPEEQVEVSEEKSSDEQRQSQSEEVDLADMITNFSDLIRKTTLFTRDEEPSFNINTNYQLIYRDRTDPDGRVERWYSPSSSGERPTITYTNARGATRTERVRATTLVYDPEDGSTQFHVHLTNGDRLIAPATKQIFDLFYNPTPSADKKLLELIPKLQYESLRGGGMKDKDKPKRSGMRRIRVVQTKDNTKGKSKDKSKGKAKAKDKTESPKVLLIANEEDAYKQLYKILGSLEAGNYSDDMVSEAGRINDYLFEQGLFDKEEHQGVAAILDKHVRNSASIV